MQETYQPALWILMLQESSNNLGTYESRSG